MKKAFTLIELLIYMGIMSVFVTVLTGIFISILEVQTQAETTSAVQMDARYLVSRLVYDIHRSQAVVTPSANGESGNTLTLTTDSSNLTYIQSDSDLLLGSDQLNSDSSSVSNFTVTRLGNPTGQPTLQISFDVSSQSEIKSYQFTASLR